ncbi:MAG TPA: DUF1015 family protein [archaeon]|nr:DUF1015 family protein [archaeon]
MVIIKPFKATILNPEMPDREKLICPVYDTIDEREYDRYGSEKNNVIHITTRKKSTNSSEFIAAARQHLDRFFKDKVLTELEHPAFYIYGIRYSLPDEIMGQIPDSIKRDVYFAFGLMALVKVEGLGEGNIVGHEKIFEKHSAERIELMRACEMNFAPIASEYNMPGHEINNLFEQYLGFNRPDLVIRDNRPPLLDLTLKGNRHLLWEITDDDMIKQIQALMADEKVLILDGHHRYNATYKLCIQDGVEYTMMMFMEGGDRALLLLPWHRCIKGVDTDRLMQQLNRYYEKIWQGADDDKEFYKIMNARDDPYDVKIGWYDGNGFSIFRAQKGEVGKLSDSVGERVGLDYISLNEWIIGPCMDGNNVDNLAFCDSVTEAVKKVDEQGYDGAFLMRALSIKEVEHKAHVEMKNFPQKSTLFVPKVAEGIIMRRFGK